MSGFGHIKSFGIGVVILGTAEQPIPFSKLIREFKDRSSFFLILTGQATVCTPGWEGLSDKGAATQ